MSFKKTILLGLVFIPSILWAGISRNCPEVNFKNELEAIEMAQTPSTSQEETSSLDHVLASDGSIKKGIEGSFNASGYRLSYDEKGAPKFSKNSLDDGIWSSVGSATHAAINGSVEAVTVSGDNIYIGGNFTEAGGNPDANHIAMWNGNEWEALGNGIDGNVYQMLVDGSDLYVVGWFDVYDITTVIYNGIARWDGSAWHSVGGDIQGTTYTVFKDGATLYIGGVFSQAGDNTATARIAKLVNNVWEPVGNGFSSGGIRAFEKIGTDLYVGGDFKDHDGVAEADGILRWDGTSWHPLATGIDGTVNALATDGTNLFIGGHFRDVAGDTQADNFIVWDGTAWVKYGSGFNSYLTEVIYLNNELYIAGGFSTPVPRLAKWDGTSWQQVGNNVGSTIFGLDFKDGNPIAGGVFKDVENDFLADYLVQWNGSSWEALGNRIANGAGGLVTSILVIDDDIYVAGHFTSIGNIQDTRYIAKWDGTAWSALDRGLPSSGPVLAYYGGKIYAGGYYYMMVWDGTSWESIVDMEGTVFDLKEINGRLYVGGYFLDLDGNDDADYAAIWDGTTWSPVAGGLTERVDTIDVQGSDIILGGRFTDVAGIDEADHIVKWDGTNWVPLAEGLNADVYTIAVHGTRIYAGGRFTDVAGNSNTDYIAYFEDGSWHALGNYRPQFWVRTMVKDGDDIFIGGAFTYFGTGTNNDYRSIVRWDGQNIYPLGKGLNDDVYTIYIASSEKDGLGTKTVELYAGGDFTRTGDETASLYNIAHYQEMNIVSTEEVVPQSPEIMSTIFPNPASEEATIQFSIPETQPITIKLFNVLGQEIKTVQPSNVMQGNVEHYINFNTKGLSKGMYILRIEGTAFTNAKSVIVN